jgi:N6-L-threonylcarbamoyladenine synthase
MRLLGIETSCDETSASVLRGSGNDTRVESLVILSQDIHRIFGGVVPEIASRAHVTALVPVVERALADTNIERDAIEAVAVTNGPGLVGALLVGVSFAKAFAYALDVPVIGVHHMEGHLFATALEERDAVPPFTALLISGGHTLLLDVQAWGNYRLLGQTRDDAAGEAFDKVAKLLGLPYPGGPAVGHHATDAMRQRCGELGARVYAPSARLATDNAAMIARAGLFHLEQGQRSALDLNAFASLALPGLAD